MQYRSLERSSSFLLSIACGGLSLVAGGALSSAGCLVVVEGGSGGSGGATTTTTTTAGSAGSGGSTPSECPVNEPAFGGQDPCGTEGQECGYGEECCNGNCYTSDICVCSGGTWYCNATDACFGVPQCDPGLPTDDVDGDGYNEEQGDCDDCDAAMNPGAVEVIATEPDASGTIPPPVDEDCDGLMDGDDPDLNPCDAGLALNSVDPMDAVKALGLCDKNNDGTPKFVQKASWVLADGQPPGANVDMANYHLGHGLLTHFGANDAPQEGSLMLALSSGTARNKDDVDFVSRNFNKGYSSPPPATFFGDTVDCPQVTVPGESVQDAAALEIKLVAPTNAKSFEFSFHYRTYDFPTYVCTPFADYFWTSFLTGGIEQNVARDTFGDPITANGVDFSQCDCPPAGPGSCQLPVGPLSSCDGVDLLLGTDFMGNTNPVNELDWTNAGTGWLKSTVPLTPNQPFTIRFTIFDSGIANGVPDHNADSTVTIDGFRWRGDPGDWDDLPE